MRRLLTAIKQTHNATTHSVNSRGTGLRMALTFTISTTVAVG
jgi:hypothetical protein